MFKMVPFGINERIELTSKIVLVGSADRCLPPALTYDYSNCLLLMVEVPGQLANKTDINILQHDRF